VYRRWEQRLRETGSVKPTAVLKAGPSRTVRRPANEDAIIAAVEQEPWRSSRDITRELGVSKPRVHQLLHDSCIHTTHYTRSEFLFYDDWPLCMKFGDCNNTLRISSFHTKFFGRTKCVLRVAVFFFSVNSVTSGHGVISCYNEHGYHFHFSVSFCTRIVCDIVWTPICYHTGWLLNDIVIFLKCSTGIAWRCAAGHETLVVVSAQRNSSALWGRCPAVVERDIQEVK
jgi:hypothetical protein